MNRVCFISVYFGIIPDFFRTFLDSCKWNNNYDWLIVHDKTINVDLPQNVTELVIDFDDFRELINEKVGISIPSITPYKVCDYRPAFGVIFEEYLRQYEFWGICDNDLLLGKLDHFIDDIILNSYDKIFTMGHMSIVRNNKKCNWLFTEETMNSRNYKDVFLDVNNQIYDEFRGFTEKFCDKGFRVYKEKLCADVSSKSGRIRINEPWFIKCIQPQNQFIKYSKARNYRHQVFWLSNGQVFRTFCAGRNIRTEEYMYIHKLDYAFHGLLNEGSSVLITPKGYIEDKEFIKKLESKNITPKELDKYNKMSCFSERLYDIYWFFRWKFRWLKYNLKRIKNG